MLGAVATAAVALLIGGTQADAGMWRSPQRPTAGELFVGFSAHDIEGRLHCHARVGGLAVQVLSYWFRDLQRTVCVFSVPPATGGRELSASVSWTFAAVGGVGEAFSLVQPWRIRDR